MSPESELERLYDAHAVALYAFGISLTRSRPDTCDLMQDLFLKLARQPGLLAGVRDERSFLLRLLHNAAVDLFRRRATRASHAEPLAEEAEAVFAPSADPDEAALRASLAEALLALPREQAEVLHLKLWEGYTFEQIAGVLGIPANTAASRYRYGLDKMRDRLRPLYEELP